MEQRKRGENGEIGGECKAYNSKSMSFFVIKMDRWTLKIH